MNKMKMITTRTTAALRYTNVTSQKANRYNVLSQSFPYSGLYMLYIQYEPMKNQQSIKHLINDEDLDELFDNAWCRMV